MAAKVKEFVKESSPSDVMQRLKSLKGHERKTMRDQLYIQRWVHWTGTVAGLDTRDVMGLTILLEPDPQTGQVIRLGFHPSERETVEDLTRGQVIEYEGRITNAAPDELQVYVEQLDGVTFRP